jgi:hypothetical protein
MLKPSLFFYLVILSLDPPLYFIYEGSLPWFVCPQDLFCWILSSLNFAPHTSLPCHSSHHQKLLPLSSKLYILSHCILYESSTLLFIFLWTIDHSIPSISTLIIPFYSTTRQPLLIKELSLIFVGSCWFSLIDDLTLTNLPFVRSLSLPLFCSGTILYCCYFP